MGTVKGISFLKREKTKEDYIMNSRVSPQDGHLPPQLSWLRRLLS
jgi:hypothetical protein